MVGMGNDEISYCPLLAAVDSVSVEVSEDELEISRHANTELDEQQRATEMLWHEGTKNTSLTNLRNDEAPTVNRTGKQGDTPFCSSDHALWSKPLHQ